MWAILLRCHPTEGLCEISFEKSVFSCYISTISQFFSFLIDMKTLYLVRHAEAAQPAGGTSDKYRALTPQGLMDAARVSRLLASRMGGITCIVCSEAERTQMTAQVFAEQLSLDTSAITQLDELLYEGSPRNYLAAVNAIDPSHQTAMLVGHNPSISYLAEYLCKEEFGQLPTCSVVALQWSNLNWAEISKWSASKLFYESPDSAFEVSGGDFGS
jgi:phosphohistidine phosphatase